MLYGVIPRRSEGENGVEKGRPCELLAFKRKKGKSRHVGVSNYGVWSTVLEIFCA
jgi:hypothetical protein